jgi:putative DNA primase/helicase
MTDLSKRPPLVVHRHDLPATARELAGLIARSGRVFDRGGPVKVLPAPGATLPRVQPLSPDHVVNEAHAVAQPIHDDDGPPMTLPHRVARLYLALDDHGLQPLKGITSAPLLSADGSIRVACGYDSQTGLWCADIPTLDLLAAPTFEQAHAALQSLREAFRTFPFADAATLAGEYGLAQVDLSQPPAQDESAFLCGLLTAICRSSLPLAPGLLIVAPLISGAGSGKGLLVRSIAAIANGFEPRAFTAGENVAELDKRLASELIEASPTLFLDNVNSRCLRSELLASVLTEPLVGVRILGASRTAQLNARAFVAVTGNGLHVSEDLTRRFTVCELDPRVENPERRPFAPGFQGVIAARRPDLLTAALTIWRWGRINAATLKRGLPIGSYETWAEWVRDPVLTLGCADPVERVALIKARDPERARLAAIFMAWRDAYGDSPVTAAKLDPRVRALIDPQERGRQFVAAFLDRRQGVRVAGFVLTRQESPGDWSPATYALRPAHDETPAQPREGL